MFRIVKGLNLGRSDKNEILEKPSRTTLIHEKGEEKNFIDTMHHLYVLISEKRRCAEKRLVFVSQKNIGFYK